MRCPVTVHSYSIDKKRFAAKNQACQMKKQKEKLTASSLGKPECARCTSKRIISECLHLSTVFHDLQRLGPLDRSLEIMTFFFCNRRIPGR